MFYSQVILAKKGPLAKVWLAAHWGDKKLARPQIFATDISQSCKDIMNPSVPLALRLSGHLLLGVVRIYSRKVKYVLSDCTEAMLKLQMAFARGTTGNFGGGATGGGGDRELLTDQDAPSNNLITNFGEFDHVHVVEGFCLPLPEDNEWILAEDDDEEAGSPKGRQALLLAAQLPQTSQQGGRTSGASPGFPSPEEETWAPFDPDNEDDEEEEENPKLPGESRVSEIELVRAGNDSILSDDQTRRASSIFSDSKDIPGTGNEKNQEEPDDDFNMPLADNSEDEQGSAGTSGAPKIVDTLLRLSEGESTGGTNNKSNLSGLEDSPSSKRSRDAVNQGRKRRKRRKIVIDNHKTELSDDYIRKMLKDTSDIVLKMVPPSSWEGEDSVHFFSTKNGEKPRPPSITQPFLVDEAEQTGTRVHPRLLKLWEDSYWRALEKPCPYKKQSGSEGDNDSVEKIRHDEEVDESNDDESDSEIPIQSADKTKKVDEEEPDDFAMPPMDEDEEEEVPADAPAGNVEDEEEEEDVLDDEEGLNLGFVNDMVMDSDEEDSENRQESGDVASSTTKWHKHTVVVFQHLKKNIHDPNSTTPENEDLPSQAGFLQMTKNVKSRRAAASAFFEILQLKTWDFIELDQDEPYGEITVSPGVRFSEDPPT